MARPMIGDALRNQVVTIRITRAEADYLNARFGSPGKGLRALLDTLRIEEILKKRRAAE